MSRTPSPSRHSHSTPPETRETPPYYSRLMSPESPSPSTPTTTIPVPNSPPPRPRRQQAPSSYLMKNGTEQLEFLEESEGFEVSTNALNFDNLALALDASGLMEEKQKEIHEERMKALQSLVKSLEGDEWMFFRQEKSILPF